MVAIPEKVMVLLCQVGIFLPDPIPPTHIKLITIPSDNWQAASFLVLVKNGGCPKCGQVFPFDIDPPVRCHKCRIVYD